MNVYIILFNNFLNSGLRVLTREKTEEAKMF